MEELDQELIEKVLQGLKYGIYVFNPEYGSVTH